MKYIYTFLVQILIMFNLFAQGKEVELTDQVFSNLMGEFQTAIAKGDSSRVFEVANNLAGHYRATGDHDSLYYYQDILIAYFNNAQNAEDYVLAVKDNHFLDRIYGRDIVNNEKIKILFKWKDSPKLAYGSKADIAHVISGYYQRKGEIDSMLAVQEKGVLYADSISGFSRHKVISKLQLGVYLVDAGHFARALKFLTDAEQKVDEIDSGELIKISLFKAMSFAMLELKDVSTARVYRNKISDIIEENGYKRSIYHLHNLDAKIAAFEEKYDSAIDFYNKALSIDKKRSSRMGYLVSLAGLHIKNNELNNGKIILDSIVDKNLLVKQLELPALISYVEYYLAKKKYKEASSYLSRINNVVLSSGHLRLRVLGINQKYFNAVSNESKELEYVKLYSLVKDSLDDLANTALSRRLEVEYDREKSKIQIDALEETNSAQKKALTNRNTLIGVTCLGLLLLGGLLYRLFGLNKKQKVIQEELSTKNQKLTKALDVNQLLNKEIHHRVKNNLQVVSSLLNLQARSSSDDNTKEALKSSKSRVQSMSILHHSLYQKDSVTSTDIKNYFEEIIESVEDTYQDDMQIHVESDIESKVMDVEDLVPLGLILTEILTNAYKHAFVGKNAGKIRIRFNSKNDDGKCELRIEDDGIGLPEGILPAKQGSLGHKLIKEFTRRLDGNLLINSVERGTSISILFET